MTFIDNVKREIEQKTGVPASLLTGSTLEENVAQAKALLAYKGESDAALDQIKPYPALSDPGELLDITCADNRPTVEQFDEWFCNQLQGLEL